MIPGNSSSTLIETFEVVRGVLQRIDLHHKRMCRSGHKHGFCPPSLQEVTSTICNLIRRDNLSKHPSLRCTVEYRTNIIGCRAIPYRIRDIHALLLIESTDSIEYADKWSDRTCFDPLSALCTKGQEPLIIRENLLTDTTYTNVVIERNGEYLTPDRPLLAGTRRQYYLDQGLIRTANLTIQDTLEADRIHLINAMMPLGALTISPENISII
ncbi:hypothetical protein HQ35_02445 [Porphyromonas cangingivalis]|uniref:4-amino-4-deoxychorismate lyase n=1 Tax=Porphyromonas cangingivalis TaxID=36874 RepID=A0A0A2F1T8_PORCN|nr:aminotransferase class IV [Porphyromonas cangingivalis]KGN82434.1 hypothetical protein HQ35_02445 [Porphyromonas cangingivalis]